jgi:hypothetical protein
MCKLTFSPSDFLTYPDPNFQIVWIWILVVINIYTKENVCSEMAYGTYL